MLRAILILAVLASCTQITSFASDVIDKDLCGLTRKPVKTTTDVGAAQIVRTPKDTTIADMVQLVPPGKIGLFEGRIAPVETTVWRLTASINAALPEKDGDYHLRLMDGNGHQMIAESVSLDCAKGSDFINQIAAVRKKVEAGLPLHTPLTFTGIGFFDYEHGVVGSAPNKIELHPLLGVE